MGLAGFRDVIVDVDNDWGECIIPIGSEIYAHYVRLDSRFSFHGLNHLHSML